MTISILKVFPTFTVVTYEYFDVAFSKNGLNIILWGSHMTTSAIEQIPQIQGQTIGTHTNNIIAAFLMLSSIRVVVDMSKGVKN